MTGSASPCPLHPLAMANRACVRCGRELCGDCLVLLRGQEVCGPCKVFLIRGAQRIYTGGSIPGGCLAIPASGSALDEGRCSQHEGNRAVCICDRCGDFLCGLCATPIEGRVYCTACYAGLEDQGSFRYVQRAYTDPQVALWYGVASLLCLPVAFGLAPSALMIAASCLQRFRQKPELPGIEKTRIAIVLAVVSLVVNLCWVIGTIARR